MRGKRRARLHARNAVGLSLLLLAQSWQIGCISAAYANDDANAIMRLPAPPPLPMPIAAGKMLPPPFGFPRRPPPPGASREASSKYNFSVTVSTTTAEKSAPIKISAGQPLSSQRLTELLRRLPDLTASPESKKPIFPEQNVVKPEAPATTIKQPFPPTPTSAPEKPSTRTTQALTITRFSPSGAVASATELAIQFSQPMVAITDVDKVDSAANIPAKISPSIEGSWKWMGAQTLVFQPKRGKFAQSTQYHIDVSAGTKSATGGELKTSKDWTFTTETVKVTSFFPNEDDSQGRSPVMILGFSQPIDAEKILKLMHLRAGKRQFALQLLPHSAAPANNIPTEDSKCWFAFAPEEKLPLGTRFELHIDAGCPSLEGPLTSKASDSYKFSTYGKLAIDPSFVTSKWQTLSTEAEGASLAIPFTNALDEKRFKPSMVQIMPAVPGLATGVYDKELQLAGGFSGHTHYTATIGGALADTKGQTLGKTTIVRLTTGALDPWVSGPDAFVTIQRGQPPVAHFRVAGVPRLVLTVNRVKPADYLRWKDKDKPHVGMVVKTQIVNARDKFVNYDLDLSPYLQNGTGQFTMHCEAPGLKDFEKYNGWLQVTDLGIDAFDTTDLLVAASTLSGGSPIPGVSVQLLPNGSPTTTTDARGVARLHMPTAQPAAKLLVATKGSDSSILPCGYTDWLATSELPAVEWYTVLDTALYRPGDDVHFKGWVRAQKFGKRLQTELYSAQPDTISYIAAINSEQLAKGSVAADQFGGFSGQFKLPEHVSLGNAALHFSLHSKDPALSDSEAHEVENAQGFSIQEFRKPDFECSLKADPGQLVMCDQPVKVTTQASFYAGGALKDVPTYWNFSVIKSQFSPPGWSDYKFGSSRPWFMDFNNEEDALANRSLSGSTDSSGRESLDLHFDKVPYPVSCKYECTVTDPNQQALSQNDTLLVHPSNSYVGVLTDNYVYDKDKPLAMKVVVVDTEGKPQSGRTVNLTLCEASDGKPLQSSSVVSTSKPTEAEFKPMPAGDYQILADVVDEKGNHNQTTVSTWVERVSITPSSTMELQKAVIVPDKQSYTVGETAHIFVASPFGPASGILTLRRHGIPAVFPISMTDKSGKVDVPITSDYYPNADIQVSLQGKDSRFADGTVSITIDDSTRTLKLAIQPKEKKLAPGADSEIVCKLTDSAGLPVKQGQIALAVVDESVLALDGYSWPDPITNSFYTPVTTEGGNEYLRATVKPPEPKAVKKLSMQRPIVPQPEMAALPAPSAAAPSGGASVEKEMRFAGKSSADKGADSGATKPKFNVRKLFTNCALFAPSLVTDENGNVQVKLHLPDNLTRYRIMAAAVDKDTLFGHAESTVTARLPLMVRPSPPRFLNLGDSCLLPVSVQNQTDADMNVDVIARSHNAVLGSENPLADVTGQSIKVPANSTVAVAFTTRTNKIGTAQFQFAAASGDLSDASEQKVPVQKPATFEAFATYGEIDKSGAVLQKVVPPANALEEIGGLSVTTSSTAMQSLSDALFYLRHYPYECSEQISARVLATLALRDVLSQFGIMSEADKFLVNDQVKKDIQMLRSRERRQGGFGLWSATETYDDPYVSLQVIRALYLARDKDFGVSEELLGRCDDYIRHIDHHLGENYQPTEQLAIQAYAAYLTNFTSSMKNEGAKIVADALGIYLRWPKKGNQLYNLDDASIESLAWLLPELDKKSARYQQVLQLIQNKVHETASTAAVETDGYGEFDWRLYFSPTRANAVVFETLQMAEPQNSLIPKLAKGLLSARNNGIWKGTQENCLSLLALQRYFATYEKATPNFETQVWLGNTFAGSSKFVGRSTDRREIDVPISTVQKLGPQDLLISKNGDGRLYYRVGLDYARADLMVAERDQGFHVTRTYEAMDKSTDVLKDPSGTWHFKLGADIKVKVKFTCSSERYHVALVDPLPAGAEPMNPALSGARVLFNKPDADANAPAPPSPGGEPDAPPSPVEGYGADEAYPMTPWWTWQWFDHQNLRDNQAEAFASDIQNGTYTYSYIIHATTAGSYVVPPCKAEEMYEPETFGRTSTEHVVIE
ncbi:MAG TPA: alpha-2-macroglobulin family protein [Planktothrix sp.]|jgi:hypothetical protein